MEIYLIVVSLCSFIVSLCYALSFGKLIRIILLKILFPNAKLKDLESFEKNSKRDYFFDQKSNRNDL